MGGKIRTLQTVWNTIQSEIQTAVNDNNHPFRFPVIGTINKEEPNLRIVVLRKVKSQPFILTFYTDSRSQKVEELQVNTNLTWLFWNPASQTQIKIISEANIEEGTANNQEIWENMHIGAKAAYLTRSAPSTPQSNPTNGLSDSFFEGEKEQSSRYFRVFHCKVKEVEWLQLSRGNNLRARFSIEEEGGFTSTWLVP